MAHTSIRITKPRLGLLIGIMCLMTFYLTSYMTHSTPYLRTMDRPKTSRILASANQKVPDDVSYDLSHDSDRRASDVRTVQAGSSLNATASRGVDAIIETDDTVARALSQHVRVLVWVMTSPKSHGRAKTIKKTWGQRVHPPDTLLFFSSVEEPALPTIPLAVEEGREHLTAKTMKAFDYIHDHYLEKADFFMKVDDDTFVIMENLRYFLSHQDPDKPFVTGRHFKHKVKQGFPSGGAGYVLSRAALELLGSRIKNPPRCQEDGLEEDVKLGRCLEKLGVPILNSTDSRGASRFHPYPPHFHVIGGLGKNYEYWDANIVRIGPQAINEYPITFHYIKPDDMKLLHFYLYRIRLYGINYKYT